MPRTPAPLTVREFDDGFVNWWLVETSNGVIVGTFREEADARAFVALPQLQQTLEVAHYALDEARRTISVDHPVRYQVEDAMAKVEAALALVDGPSPREET